MGRIPHDYVERCYAGWLGKIIGIRHGAPVESWDYEKIRELIGEIDGYLVDYNEFASDDDSNGPLCFIRALDDYNSAGELTPEQIGLTWLNYAPCEHGFFWWGGYGSSTEHTAYLNLRAGIMAPRSGSVEQNGSTIAEQIGGQIFIDAWGLVIPGNPALAASYAAKAASVSHGGNGVYGGMFVAAAISAAFTAKNMDEALDKAFSVIPGDCEYARMVADIRRYHALEEDGDWRKCYEYIRERWGYGRYPGSCHIIPNAAVVVMSLLYARGSFDRALNICVMAGWDTDCNAGNTGAIIGTLLGLEGIGYDKWRRPVNDFLAASSVIGSMNITDLAQNVRYFSRLAYRLAGENCDPRWDGFLGKDASRFNFELPGSTQAFRMRGCREMLLLHEDRLQRRGLGCLKALFKDVLAGQKLQLYQQTYYRPRHFHDSRYDPAFSPLLYPGQTVSAWVMCGAGARLRAAIYAWDGNTENMLSGPELDLPAGEWARLEYRLPALSGSCMEEAGVLLTVLESGKSEALVYFDDMDFSGCPDYTLDFGAERIEDWGGLHKEVSQMTRLKGIWTLEEGCLSGSCPDFGEAYTGDTAWENVEVTCRLKPLTGALWGFNMRVQGAIRSYSVAADGRCLLLQKNDNGYLTLASAPYDWPLGEVRTLAARAEGDMLTVMEDNRILLSYKDENNPYLAGMVGLRVERGGHAHYERLSVRGLPG